MVSSLYVRSFPPVGPPDPKTLYLPRLPKAKDVTGQILKGVTHLPRPRTINLELWCVAYLSFGRLVNPSP